MRIAILSTSYPCHKQDPAGHFVRAEARALGNLGHDVHVVAPCGPDGTLAHDPSIRTWPLPHGGAFGWPGAPSRLRAKPWRLAGAATFAALASDQLRRLKPDRIVAHWILPCAHPIVSASRFAGELEVVAHGADVRMLLALPSTLRTHVMARVIAMSTRIRFAAHASYQALTASLPQELQNRLQQRVEIRPADIRVPDVSSVAKELRKVHGDGHLAVTVARLVPSKRVDLAIEAAHRLSPEIRLGVIGDGPDRDRLARVRGAELVRFEGMLPRERALAWIAAADVLVHTSEVEAAPTVIREARLLGTPVVACDAGDVALWAREDPGIACVKADANAVALAMRRIVQARVAAP